MNKDFPRIITLLREEKGLSQKQAASELGISQPLLSHYEKGIRECSLDFVVKTADYYNVTCDYLLGRTNVKPEFSIEEQWIIKCYRAATNDTKEGIKAILRQFDQENTVSLVG